MPIILVLGYSISYKNVINPIAKYMKDFYERFDKDVYEPSLCYCLSSYAPPPGGRECIHNWKRRETDKDKIRAVCLERCDKEDMHYKVASAMCLNEIPDPDTYRFSYGWRDYTAVDGFYADDPSEYDRAEPDDVGIFGVKILTCNPGSHTPLDLQDVHTETNLAELEGLIVKYNLKKIIDSLYPTGPEIYPIMDD